MVGSVLAVGRVDAHLQGSLWVVVVWLVENSEEFEPIEGFILEAGNGCLCATVGSVCRKHTFTVTFKRPRVIGPRKEKVPCQRYLQ